MNQRPLHTTAPLTDQIDARFYYDNYISTPIYVQLWHKLFQQAATISGNVTLPAVALVDREINRIENQNN